MIDESAKTSEDALFEQMAIDAKLRVKTHYIYTVVDVAPDGQFVDLKHSTLEWQVDPSSDVEMNNSFGKTIKVSPSIPDTLYDIPFQQLRRGQWNIRYRPRIGDVGWIEVFYHDTGTLKELGGYQSPEVINVMDKNNCVFVPYFPNHKQTNEEENTKPYPDENSMEIEGEKSRIVITSAVDGKEPDKIFLETPNCIFIMTDSIDGGMAHAELDVLGIKLTIDAPMDSGQAVCTIDVGSQGKIKLGGNAAERAILGDSLKAFIEQVVMSVFNQHTHMGNLGVSTSPPQTSMAIQDFMAKITKVE